MLIVVKISRSSPPLCLNGWEVIIFRLIFHTLLLISPSQFEKRPVSIRLDKEMRCCHTPESFSKYAS